MLGLFYYNICMQKGHSLTNFLDQNADEKLAHLVLTIADLSKEIAHLIQTGGVDYAETENDFGENQLALDVQVDSLIREKLLESGVVGYLTSEESLEPVRGEGEFAVAYDPLDGSSLVDANLAFGSIFGIWKCEDLVGKSGRDLVASCYIVYGPRLVLVLALPNLVCEFTLNTDYEYELTQEKITLEPNKKYFAPGGIHSVTPRDHYDNLIQFWLKHHYTLRYSGGFVSDVNHILAKQGGVFAYPEVHGHPEGKLRLSFECLPLAYIVEQAGGMAVDGRGNFILDKKITDLGMRSPIILGSKDEVERAQNLFML